MPRAIRWSTAMLASIFLVMSACAADAQTYARYCNERYGFCVDYPEGLRKDPPPVNGDGRRFHDRNGFSMTVSGSNNSLDDSVTSEMESQTGDFDRITYRAQKKNWFVLSGYKGSEILYRKTYVGEGSVNHLHIQYPARKRKEYDAMVTRISSSFEPGDLEAAH